jgi:hypothetical protein
MVPFKIWHFVPKRKGKWSARSTGEKSGQSKAGGCNKTLTAFFLSRIEEFFQGGE